MSGGGDLIDYNGIARRAPGRAAALSLALAGLAGLPPGVAGLFAKVVVVRALVGDGGTWLALAVAVNAVIGLAYYLRAAAALFAPGDAVPERMLWPAGVALAIITAAGLVHLERLTALKRLVLPKRIEDTAVEALRAKLPGCTISK